MSRSLASSVVALGFLPAFAWAGGGGYASVARGINQAAERAGVTKVQILPLVSADGEGTAEGRLVSARIMAAIIDQGKVMVVEGDLPGTLQDPYRRAEGQGAKMNVRSAAEAVVTGTHIVGARKIHLHVQLLQIRDRIVLYSADVEVKNEWEGAFPLFERRPRPVPIAAVETAAAPAGPPAADWSEPEVGEDCLGSAEEVDRLQLSIMGIKARYAARKLRVSGGSLADLPPSMIRSADLRSRFRLAVMRHLGGGDIAPLTKSEVRQFVAVDGKAFEIHSRCSVDGLVTR